MRQNPFFPFFSLSIFLYGVNITVDQSVYKMEKKTGKTLSEIGLVAQDSEKRQEEIREEADQTRSRLHSLPWLVYKGCHFCFTSKPPQ